jgi:hypothetical protein
MARPARSLDVLLAEIDAAYPGRSKASDGWIGDPAHASRPSDHNPDRNGVVRARDFTNDPASGADMSIISERIVELALDGHPALGQGSYVIWNRQIASATLDGHPWNWEPYTGDNPHNHHMHVSVSRASGGYDSTRPWGVTEEDPMANYEAQLALIVKQGEQSQRRDVALRQIVKAQGEMIEALADEVAKGDAEIKARIAASRRKLEQAIAAADLTV